MTEDDWPITELEAPWYAGRVSFLRAPWKAPGDVTAGQIAVVGMPIDEFATSAARTGMRWGPRAIREASLTVARDYALLMDQGFVDTSTGAITEWPDTLNLVDTGDIPIRPDDAAAQRSLAAEHVCIAAQQASVIVSLGGDHSVSYPAVEGVAAALRERAPTSKIGHLHIDSHGDFTDEWKHLGRYSHASVARRISEIPEVDRVVWFGHNSVAQPDHIRAMKEGGFKALTARYCRRVGMAEAMSQAIDMATEGVDHLYVSIDIDVVSGADAPGTGAPAFEGITSQEFLEALRILAPVQEIIGVDLCEVCPEIDGSRRTETLGALALFEVLGSRLFKQTSTIPLDDLRSVFLV